MIFKAIAPPAQSECAPIPIRSGSMPFCCSFRDLAADHTAATVLAGVCGGSGFICNGCCSEVFTFCLGMVIFSVGTVVHCGKGLKPCSVVVGGLDPAVGECFLLVIVWGFLERMAVAVHVFMPVLVDIYIMWLVTNRL